MPTISAVPPRTHSREIRWGRNVQPAWAHAAPVVAPLVGAALITQAVTPGTRRGYVYGLFLTSTEANTFILNWTSGAVVRTMRFPFGGAGALESVDVVAMNEGLSADPSTNVTITVLNAGAALSIYQARLLYAEA